MVNGNGISGYVIKIKLHICQKEKKNETDEKKRRNSMKEMVFNA